MSRCGGDAADGAAGVRSRVAGDFRFDNGADVFRYARVDGRSECGFVGVWKNGQRCGSERGLFVFAGYRRFSRGFAFVYRYGYGAGWFDEYIERVFVCSRTDAAEWEHGNDSVDGGQFD